MAKKLITERNTGLKRKGAAVCVAAVTLAALLPAGVLAAASGEQYIGEEKAKSIALENAGIAEADAVFLKVHPDREDGVFVYDVEFYSGNVEYDYEIDAVSGLILEYDKDVEYYSVSPSANAGQYIGEDKAKAAALEHAGISEDQATFIKAYMDHYDGRIFYEVKFYSGNTEFYYEIDAESGSILKYDQETEHSASHGSSGVSGQSAASTDDYIGEAKAKSIALSDAGVTESQIRKMKVKLDREHGKMVYEVEFKSGQTEYEYDIDAASGAILESDVEYDD